MSDLEQITVECNDAPHLRFTGELEAATSNSPDCGHPDFSGETGRWQTLRLYRTAAGKYVCHRINHTQWAGDHDTNEATVCDSEAEVIEFFGHGRLAKDLYYNASICDIQDID